MDTSDPAVNNAVKNEIMILQKLRSPLINKLEAFYEDPERNKAYIVLENAGEKTLYDYVNEMHDSNGSKNVFSDVEVRDIMTQLF